MSAGNEMHALFEIMKRKLTNTFGICENKDADQLCSNCTADQCLCFRFMASAISRLYKSEISSF